MGVFKSKWVLTANTVLLKIYKKYSVTRKAKIIHSGSNNFFTYLFHVQKKTSVAALLTDHT